MIFALNSYFVDIPHEAQKCSMIQVVHRWIIPIAVSYTHLDVYKRQPLYRPDDSHADPSPNRDGGTGISHLPAVRACGAVSYTHLGKVPDGAIGQADAMTNIQVEGAFGFDASQIRCV